MIRQSKILSDYDQQKIKNINASPIKPAFLRGRGGDSQLNDFLFKNQVKKISQIFLVIDNIFLESFKPVESAALVLSKDTAELSIFLDRYKIEEPHYKPRARDIRNLPIALAIYTRRITLALLGLLATYPKNKPSRFILNYMLYLLTRFSFVIIFEADAGKNTLVMCWFSGSMLSLTGAWVGFGRLALVHLAISIFIGRTFTQQLFELLNFGLNRTELDDLKEKIDRLLGRSDDPEYWKEKVEQLLRPNSKSSANNLNPIYETKDLSFNNNNIGNLNLLDLLQEGQTFNNHPVVLPKQQFDLTQIDSEFITRSNLNINQLNKFLTSVDCTTNIPPEFFVRYSNPRDLGSNGDDMLKLRKVPIQEK